MATDEALPPELGEFRGESFQRGHVAADADVELTGLVFVLDAQEQLPSVQRLRDWSLAAIAPATGDVAVDIGCGTGAEVRRLAALVGPEGRAVGIEPHPGLRAVATERSAGLPTEYLDGDAGALPFADASVDVVRCERVFQHLPDPAGAAREIARVLRSGGRAVVIDSDWASVVSRPGDHDVLRRYNDAMWLRTPNPFAGRDLRSQLQRAGLSVDADIGSTAVVFPDAFLTNPVMLRINADLAVEDGAITRAEADRLIEEFVAAAALGEAFFAVTMFAVVARAADQAT
jgi:ubiquinone/menaquinone biosynthesis C-methylase UbiE